MIRAVLGHTFGLAITGAIGAATSIAGAAYTVAAETGASELGPFITGGGALTSAGVLGLVAVKLTRGELVARDPAKVETALLRLVEERKVDHDAVVAMAAETQGQLREVLTAINRLPGDPT